MLANGPINLAHYWRNRMVYDSNLFFMGIFKIPSGTILTQARGMQSVVSIRVSQPWEHGHKEYDKVNCQTQLPTKSVSKETGSLL